jgi:hypothetical protein
MGVSKADRKRLDELAKQKRELDEYRKQHEQEFGPTDSALLDSFEKWLFEQEHVEIDVVQCECGFCGGELIFEVNGSPFGPDIRHLIRMLEKECREVTP